MLAASGTGHPWYGDGSQLWGRRGRGTAQAVAAGAEQWRLSTAVIRPSVVFHQAKEGWIGGERSPAPLPLPDSPQAISCISFALISPSPPGSAALLLTLSDQVSKASPETEGITRAFRKKA